MAALHRRERALLGTAAALLTATAFVPSAVPSALAAPVAAPVPAASPAPRVQPRIVGGDRAKLTDYPFAVYLTDASGSQFCGGVLIDRAAVATAAHCATAMDSKDIRVVAGREDKRKSGGSIVGVTRVWTPADFSDPDRGSDIAVLTLRRPVPYNPVRLPEQGDTTLYREGTKATVLGWGRVEDGGARSDYLRSAVVPVVSDQSCKGSYDSYDASSMVCAGYQKGGVDACQGDSGGPLVVDGTLIGIVSYGEGCAEAGKPGVYTRVASYVADVRQQLG